MKKITYLFLLLILTFIINNCAGYKPIFGQSNLNFEIVNHSIEGNKMLGTNIYSKFHSLSNSGKNDQNKRSFDIYINSTKKKDATTKDKSGKISEYRITLTTKVEITDFVSGNQIINETITISTTYKVQSSYSDTINLENRSIENLLNKTYEKLLIIFIENI